MDATRQTALGAVAIRPTREADAAALRELRLEALRAHPEAFAADYDQNYALPFETWVERARQGAGDARQITYVAPAGDTLAGMAGIYRREGPKERHNGIIWGVYVRPAWRKAGVADALLQACLNWAQTQDLPIVKLAVVATNAAAVRLYVKLGFSVYGVEPAAIFYDGMYYDELLMAWRGTADSRQSFQTNASDA